MFLRNGGLVAPFFCPEFDEGRTYDLFQISAKGKYTQSRLLRNPFYDLQGIPLTLFLESKQF